MKHLLWDPLQMATEEKKEEKKKAEEEKKKKEDEEKKEYEGKKRPKRDLKKLELTTATLITAYFFVFIVVNMLSLFETVPIDLPEIKTGTEELTYDFMLGYLPLTLAVNKHLLLVVLFGGALGGIIHGVAKLSADVFEGTFRSRDSFWYVTRPFLGAALALGLYFAFRGGVITAADVDVLNPYAVAAISVFIGVSADRVTLMIKDFLEVVLKKK